MYQLLIPDFKFSDDRGTLVQLVHGGYTQVNVITTKQGVLRGNHYHKFSHEAFYIISGSVKVTLISNGKKQETLFQIGDFFEIPPMVLHEMFYPEDCIMVALYDQPVENEQGEKDICVPEIGDALWIVEEKDNYE